MGEATASLTASLTAWTNPGSQATTDDVTEGVGWAQQENGANLVLVQLVLLPLLASITEFSSNQIAGKMSLKTGDGNSLEAVKET